MNFKHKKLDDMYRAYAATVLEIDGEKACLVASEEVGHPCYMYTGSEFENKEVVWQEGGGCMSIIQIPGKENEFLAVMDFYLKVSPSKSKLVWGKYSKETGWVIKDVVYLPFLHRFDIYTVEGQNYVVAATIADDKDHKEDWTRPGSIYKGVLPDNPTEGIDFEQLGTGYYRNHGYYKVERDNQIHGYFTSDQGIIRLTPKSKDNWEIEHVLDGMIGEVALMDVDGDGVDELMTIEPFHGDSIKIYKQTDTGYKEVFKYPYEVDFAHTLVGNTLNGKPCFVGGVRRVNSELFVITYEDDDYKVQLVDEGAGPSNLMVGHSNGQDFIISANHTRNESAIYFLEK